MALLETLQDDFNVPATSTTNWDATGNITYTGGAVVLTGPSVARLASKLVYTCDTTTNNSYLSAKITPTGAGTDFSMSISPGTDSTEAMLHAKIGGNLTATLTDSGGFGLYNQNLGTYNAATMAYLRIRTAANAVYFGYSADGNTWTESTYSGSYGAGVQWKARFSNYATIAGNVVTVDNVNIIPPYVGTVAPTSINDAQTFGAPTLTYPPLETLTDNFNDPTASSTKWTGDAAYTGGTAVMQGFVDESMTSAGSFDLDTATRFSYLSAKVARSSGSVRSELTALAQTTPANATLQIATNGNLIALVYDNTGATVYNVTIGAYDAVSMAYLRIRTAAGKVHFGYGPYGDTWTETTYTGTFGVGVRMQARFFHHGSTSGATTTIDNVNITPPYAVLTPTSLNDAQTVSAPAATLPIDRLQDDFTTGPLDTVKWSTTGIVGSTATVAGGTLNIDTAAGLTNPIGSVRSVAGYSFTGSGVFAKVVPDPTAAGQTTHLRVIPFNASNEVFYFIKTGGNLGAFGCDTTGNVFNSATITYDPVAHAWWKIRHTAGTIYWETSPDGLTWTIRLQHVYAPQVEPYRARMYTQWTGTSTAGTVSFDNVNVSPPYAAPTSIGDTDALGGPAAVVGAVANPNPVTDAETLDDPTIVATGGAVTPDPISDGETLDNPDVVLPPVDLTANPDPAADAETLGNPGADFTAVDTAVPDSIEDPEELQGLDVGATDDTAPDPIGDPESFGNPAGTFTADAQPDGIGDTETFGPPTPIRNNNVIVPDSIPDPGTLGDVQALVIRYPQYFPDSIVDIDLVFRPDSLIFRVVSNWNYGEGIYSDGPYSGSEPIPQPPTPDEIDNLTYGTGTYGYGIYYGTIPAPLPDDPEPTPLLSDIAGLGQPPLHILGIGPWSPTIVWRGLPNYLIDAGKRPARPAMALPPATSKGFTLRLAEGSEARIDLAMRRDEAIVIDEMDTDLWWRRKDPRTKRLEVIGRFNCSHIEMSTSDTGVNMSAQFEDYVTVLGARMVLKYLNPTGDPPTSIWDIHTPVTDILAFALPDNTGLDLSEATGARPYPLGNIIQPYDLPPSATIADLMANLIAISPVAWEWWIETPADVNLPPKLRFVLGERGSDKGVTLLDAGSGPTPIAAWTKNGAADNYANSLYYTGVGTGTGKDAGGGVVEQIDSAIAQYGQRDALYGSTTQGGDIKQIQAGAVRKLDKLADRKPTYTITLTHGFWRGRNHIDVGDTITLILRLNRDVTVTKYRVSEIAVAIDDNGMEDVTLTLGKPRASSDPRSSQSPFMRLLRTLKNYEAPSGAATIPPPED